MDVKINIPVTWDSAKDQTVFANVDISGFDDIWNIEQNERIDLKVMRSHVGRTTGTIERQTVRFDLNGKTYFLKRTSGHGFACIKAEYRALSIVPEFGICPARPSAHAFDENNRRGFLLFQNMEGFHSLADIKAGSIERKAAEKIGDVKRFYPRIISIFRKVQKSSYFYRDWMEKHIFINPETDQIGLIDLERFVPKSHCPFHWRLPGIYRYKRKKEEKILRKTLGLESL